MKIRPINVKDIPEVLQIMLDNWDGVMAEHHSVEIVRKFRSEVSADWLKRQMDWKRIFVVEKDDRIVATGALADFGQPGNPKLCVSQFFVSSHLHGRGIGKCLLKYLTETAKKDGTQQLHVPSSRNAIPFYKSAGFVTDPVQTDAADEITWMSMDISSPGASDKS
ncbi:MAG TPA: GNAT family N-acetyltransferase [Phycisphaerae bacterium]|nr:GNAT family N-acetyltransferase [Phycisphaerae bacterium]HPS51963.1 GNAT family N-acetyltransferase [Phycisphaerae bacterium]